MWVGGSRVEGTRVGGARDACGWRKGRGGVDRGIICQLHAVRAQPCRSPTRSCVSRVMLPRGGRRRRRGEVREEEEGGKRRDEGGEEGRGEGGGAKEVREEEDGGGGGGRR